MKKTIALLMALILCLSMCACSSNSSDPKQAFTDSKTAFECITTAYVKTNAFSRDLYEAWFQGVKNSDNCDDESELENFVDELDIEMEHIQKAIANLCGKEVYEYGDWEFLPYMYGGSYFSAWVSVVSEAYKCSGKTAEIEASLEEAKNLMKQLSDEYADYEHYPSLKKYFTNTLAFFDFCNNPEGSFEQVVETFNNYRNTAREYFFDLNYVFGDSIGGMSEYEEAIW